MYIYIYIYIYRVNPLTLNTSAAGKPVGSRFRILFLAARIAHIGP